MDAKDQARETPASFWKTLGLGALILAVLLGVVFRKSFQEGQIVFSNDGPLGVVASQADNPIGAFSGLWQPLNWIGNQAPNSLPNLTQALYFLTGPIPFCKFYAPFACFVLGLAALTLFYRLGFSRWLCVLGGIVAAFNTDFFSYACWGLGSVTLCMGFAFFALAALSAGRNWAWSILGGLAVGMGIMEGFDVGAIMSLYIAAFVLFRAWVEHGTEARRALINGGLRVTLVALFAAVMAAQALTTLVGTQIKGIAGASQQDAGKEERWNFATQWSLPKRETLRVLIPGLYGYRMDTPEGGQYWGTVGQQPGWQPNQPGLVRFSGAGFYVGAIVLLFAAYALFESLRKDSPLTTVQRAHVRFWAVAALLSLLFSFGRHAPFYQIVYALPYFSTIRNPVKFMHPFSLSVIVMFGYGVHALLLRSRVPALKTEPGLSERLKQWWKVAAIPERKWTWGCIAFTGLCALGFMIYSSSGREMTDYLTKVQIPPADAAQILKFTYKEIALFLLFWSAGLAVLVLFLAGFFRASRARAGVIILGILISADMVRANLPWVVYYDYREKYASNPVLDILRERPYEQRVATRFTPFGGGNILAGQDQMNGLFTALWNEWLQHQFQFYRIHALDIVQMPRIPELDSTFAQRFRPGDTNGYHLFGRLWQLTNTRYLIGERAMLDVLNSMMDLTRSVTILTNFDVVQAIAAPRKIEDFTVQLNPEGRYSLFNVGSAAPRAALYGNWEVRADGPGTLERLADPQFNPLTQAVVDASGGMSPTGTNQPGSVTITRYQPRHVELTADVKSPSLLVLLDRWDPQWSVTVNGKKENLVRANYIFRGVFLPAGTHRIEFDFRTPVGALYVSVAAIVAALGLCFYVGLRGDEPSMRP